MPHGEGKQAPSTTAEQPGKGPWLPGGIAGSATEEEGGRQQQQHSFHDETAQNVQSDLDSKLYTIQ